MTFARIAATRKGCREHSHYTRQEIRLRTTVALPRYPLQNVLATFRFVHLHPGFMLHLQAERGDTTGVDSS